MTMALELSFDAASDRRVQQLWVDLSRLYPPPGVLEMGGQPHVSLAVFRRGEPAQIHRVVAELAARLSPFTLKLSAVGAFRTEEGVVFLAPGSSCELRNAHEQALEVLGADAGLMEPYYHPAAWRPHCTVACNVPFERMNTVIDACQRAHTPFEANVRRLSAVRYRPAVSVCSSDLG